MNLKELVAKLPEADREEGEKAIQAAVLAGDKLAGIDSEEKAREFILKTPILKTAMDAYTGKAVTAHDERFTKEKLPTLIEAEIKRRNPEKDPLRIELDAMKAEREAEKAELKRERLKALAIKRAADAGIPADDIERFIDEDEDRTTASVEAFAKRWKAYSDKAVETALKDKLGNNGAPRGGNPPAPPADLMTRYKEALKDPKRADEALVLHEQLEIAARQGA
jgi:hypothetical protein